jgi:photosystem II stability/assembly factor-like uncharacterized protein
MTALVMILVGGFIATGSAPPVPFEDDTGLSAQAEPETGPSAGEPVWQNLGPGGGGWIQSICASPHWRNVLLVGCDVGGLYRSTDSGASYTSHNTGLQDYYVECIVHDPLDRDVIYLGCQSGVYKSTDRSRTWQWLREGFPPKNLYDWSAPIGALALDPQNPAVLYAGIGRPRQQQFGRGAVYKTVDAGGHWSQVNTPGSLPADAIVTDLVIDPRDSRRLFLACQYGVYRSDNGGVGWVRTIAGLPHPYVRRIALCRAQPDNLYLTLRAVPGRQPWQGGVYRSTDGGLSWTPRTQGLKQQVGQPGQADQMTANYDRLVVHPDNPDVVYVGGNAWVNATIYKTQDGGATWTDVLRRGDGGNTDEGWITFTGPAVTCLDMSPFDPETLYFGTSMRVFRTTDGGGSWRQIYTRMLEEGRFQGTGLETTCLFDVVVHPLDPQRLYFCYWDIGLLISQDGGQSFRRCVQGIAPTEMQTECFTVAFDPYHAEHCWGSFGSATLGVIAESFDGGVTWDMVGTASAGLPGVPHRVLRVDGAGRLATLADGRGVYVSEDSGRTWQPRNSGLTHAGVRDLVCDPGLPGRWWCALGDDGTNPGAVFRTDDAGRSWRQANRDLSVADVKRLVLAPSDPQRLYLAVRDRYMGGRSYPGGVYRSDNGGVTWRRILTDNFVQGLAVDPRRADVVYAGLTDHPYHDESTGDGIRVTRDGGQTWDILGEPSCRQVNCITVDPHDPDQVYLGTGGNGVFVGRVSDSGPR